MRIDGASGVRPVYPDAASTAGAAGAATRAVPRDKIELSQQARAVGGDADGDHDGS